MRVAVWLACSACSFTPRAQGTDADPGGEPMLPGAEAGAPDTQEDHPLCGAPALLDEPFDGTTPCPAWGSGFGTALTQQRNGALRVVATVADSNGGCAETSLHGWTSAIVEVSSIVTGEDAFTSFQLLGLDRAMAAVNGDLLYATGTGSQIFRRITYLPAAMRWWRMRRDDQAGTVVAEYSADATNWQLLEDEPTQAGDMRINLIAGANDNTPAGSAAYERLVICP